MKNTDFSTVPLCPNSLKRPLLLPVMYEEQAVSFVDLRALFFLETAKHVNMHVYVDMHMHARHPLAHHRRFFVVVTDVLLKSKR